MLGRRAPAERTRSPRPIYRDDCLADRAILVTGASSGIGRAVAIALAEKGARVGLNGRNEQRLKETRAQLAGTGHLTFNAELSDPDAAAAMAKEAARQLGPLDGIFHAAGSFEVRPLKITKREQLDEMFGASVFGAYGLGRAASNKTVLVNGGSLVFMSSVAAEHGSAGLAGYAGAKAAVLGLTRSLAAELAPRLVRVNAIAASTIVTEMHERTMENADMSYVAKNEERHPLGFGEPRHVTDAALFLLSDASLWITGATIPVDGGYSAV